MLKDIVEAFRERRVLVIGDVMLDEYIWGEVHRISPEAPVPIVEACRRTYAPGGAANVATNVASLGGQAFLCGVTGNDLLRGHLSRELLSQLVDTDGLIADDKRPTTTKTRVIAHNQQVVRVDSESRTLIRPDIEETLMRHISSIIETVDVCILSDYGKGVVTPYVAQQLIELAQAAGKQVLVDPKGSDYSRYRGATVVTPNVPEAEYAVNRRAANEAKLFEIAQELLDVLATSALLMTRGAQGMSLFVKGCDVFSVPASKRQVFDVTGAGDTAISTLALALAAGATLQQGARIANYAAGVVVGKLGTASLSLDELSAVIEDDLRTEPLREPLSSAVAAVHAPASFS